MSNNDSNQRGNIFDVQRMSFHDGPGIRTTVFFKGCPMRCFWCHNPESEYAAPEMLYYKEKCIGCQLCATVCEEGCHTFDSEGHHYDRTKCTACGKCANICPAVALQRSGRLVTVEELKSEVLRDIEFYKRSNGGVTASGGEPLLQSDFLAEFFSELQRESVHTAIETALNVPQSALEKVLPHLDFLIADLKHPDPKKHREVTGCDNQRIISNFRYINDNTDIPFMIRIPIIPGVNDDPELMPKFEEIFSLLDRCSCVELMPYHNFGVAKYDSLSKDASAQDGMEAPAKEKLLALAAAFKKTKVIFRDGSATIVTLGGKQCTENQRPN